MTKSCPISIAELPEPNQVFEAIDGNIVVVYRPDLFYMMSARMELAPAFSFHEKPIIEDQESDRYLMHVATADFVEGRFYILLTVGFGHIEVVLDATTVKMHLEKEFVSNYDIQK